MSAAGQLTVGVLALQGGVAEHARMLDGLGARVALLRTVGDLAGPDGIRVDALVLPGGESSTQERLLRLFGLAQPLSDAIESGVPVLGTCAGLILLSTRVLDPAPGQTGLGLLDVAVRRNAFGAQVASSEADFTVDVPGVVGAGPGGAVRGALIRAPQIAEVGPRARVIASHGGRVVGAASIGTTSVTGISFHPELTGDPAMHLDLMRRARNDTATAAAEPRSA